MSTSSSPPSSISRIAANLVAGPALDFCLAVTQRRHRSDLGLVVVGPVANEWLDVAQAFAGPPGVGREPSTRDQTTSART